MSAKRIGDMIVGKGELACGGGGSVLGPCCQCGTPGHAVVDGQHRQVFKGCLIGQLSWTRSCGAHLPNAACTGQGTTFVRWFRRHDCEVGCNTNCV